MVALLLLLLLDVLDLDSRFRFGVGHSPLKLCRCEERFAVFPCAGRVGHGVQEPPAKRVGFVLPQGTDDNVIHVARDDLPQLPDVSTAEDDSRVRE